jgi:hypothetical protein
MKRDLSSLTRNERGALGAAAAVLILSFLPWYITVTFDGPGDSKSWTAWSGISTLGVVFLLLSAALVVIEGISEYALPKVVPWHLVSAVLAVVGTALVIFHALTAGTDEPGASIGPGWSGWLLFLASIGLTVFVVRVFRESDEKIDIKSDLPDD